MALDGVARNMPIEARRQEARAGGGRREAEKLSV
jgi:hypothetical protein